MTFDPETERVALLTTEPSDADFPRGKRGRGWQIRQGDVDEQEWAHLISAGMPPDEQDELHERLWNGSQP